jgi:hypothetical protein
MIHCFLILIDYLVLTFSTVRRPLPADIIHMSIVSARTMVTRMLGNVVGNSPALPLLYLRCIFQFMCFVEQQRVDDQSAVNQWWETVCQRHVGDSRKNAMLEDIESLPFPP